MAIVIHATIETTGGDIEAEINAAARGPKGDTGDTGATGATGAQGDRAGLKYTFDTNTGPAAPSPGHIKFNSSTLSSVTRISIRDTDIDGSDTSALLALIDDSTSTVKARVVIRSNSNADISHFNFLVTSVTDEGNHHHINGTFVSGSAFTNGEVVTFDFYATGDKGDIGNTGPAGPSNITTSTATTINGLIKGNGSTVAQAIAGTDYETPAGAAAQIAPVAADVSLISGNVLPLTRRKIATSTQTGSPAPLKICQLIMGDSFGIGLPINRSVQTVRENGDFTMTPSGGAATEGGQFALTPPGQLYRMSAAGHIVTSVLNQIAHKVTCIYSTVAGGGSFALEVRADGGAWVEVPLATTANPINTDNGGAASAASFTHTFGDSLPREIRAKWISGTSRILYFILSDLATGAGHTRGGSAEHLLALGGIVIQNYATTPDSIWTTFLNAIQPDFVVIKSDDDYNLNPISGVYSKLAAIRAMDWIFLSNHPTAGQPTQILSASDQTLKSLALDNGQAFFDCRRALPNHAGIVALGLTTDNYHLNAAGNQVLQTAMMNAAGRGLLTAMEMHPTGIRGTPSYFNGTGRFFQNAYSGFTDALAIGQFREGSNSNPTPAWSLQMPALNQITEKISGNWVRMLIKNSRRIFSGGTNGLGSSQDIVTNVTRDAHAVVEFHSGNQSVPCAAVSTQTGFVGDALFGQRDTFPNSTGSRAWGVNAYGDADFKTSRNTPVTVAGLPALVNTTSGTTVGDETMTTGLYYRIVAIGTTDFTTLGAASNTVGLIFLKNAAVTYGTGTVIRMVTATATEAFVTDASVVHAGNSGTVVAGGGSNNLPVYYDGTNWRIS